MMPGDFALVAASAAIVAMLIWLVLAAAHPAVEVPSFVPPASPTVPAAVPHGSWQ